MSSSRRDFLRYGGLAAAGLGLGTSVQAHPQRVAPSDQLRYGVIGCKGMGWSNMRAALNAMPEAECVALCDVDASVLDERVADVESMRGKKPRRYKDYRRMLENKDLDVVIIGTPDHWHALQLVDTLAAGKDAYCEKPLANSVRECQAMLKATRRYDRIVQVGQWQRSAPHFAQAIDYVQSGKLGNIRLVKCWAYMGWMKSIPVLPDEPVPAGVDYDMWLGPARKRPFNRNRFHFTFRWFWDYAGGLMTDWGVHLIDIALFAMKAKAPKSVIASGGKFAYPEDAEECPDTLQAVYEYDGFNMLWEHAVGIDAGPYGRTHGIAFIGNNGTLVVDRQGWELIPETENVEGRLQYKLEQLPPQGRSGNALEDHHRNFAEAVKTRDRSLLKCEIETGSVAAINAHMGNAAFRTGRKLYWDTAANQFRDDATANGFLMADYHNGWELPKG
ncbi:MAG: gfo/Idh/MocA family oxidoreductase [Bacteroidetes bacterium]|nr:MAG: gfo/Idh/MocA family oxidoreductase [Bacteroidota bacterium]